MTNLPIATHQEFFTGEPEGAATGQPVAHGLVVGQVHHGRDAHGHHPALAPESFCTAVEKDTLSQVTHTVIKSPQLLLWSRGLALTVMASTPMGVQGGRVHCHRSATLWVF